MTTEQQKDIEGLAVRLSNVMASSDPSIAVGACLFLLYMIFAGQYPRADMFTSWSEHVSAYLVASLHTKGGTPLLGMPGKVLMN